mmetsp:Transcript_10626/g.19242  ORF Transcript_10626/g.19242 Transcript_10626/m.19242 type:complete len:200 (+) Transcript_10626:199-798(+)
MSSMTTPLLPLPPLAPLLSLSMVTKLWPNPVLTQSSQYIIRVGVSSNPVASSSNSSYPPLPSWPLPLSKLYRESSVIQSTAGSCAMTLLTIFSCLAAAESTVAPPNECPTRCTPFFTSSLPLKRASEGSVFMANLAASITSWTLTSSCSLLCFTYGGVSQAPFSVSLRGYMVISCSIMCPSCALVRGALPSECSTKIVT